MFCLILLVLIFSRRRWYGYHPYGYGYGYGPYGYPYGSYTPYDPYWRAQYCGRGYGNGYAYGYGNGYGYPGRCW